MAEFQEVLKQWSRMCEKHICNNRDKSEPILPVCPLVTKHFGHLCDDAVTDLSQESVAQIEEIVMSWAVEHPEPVYPTWREYLTSIGVIPEAVILQTEKDEFNTFWRWDEACALTNKRIPADIAEKLGIEPEERRINICRRIGERWKGGITWM